LPSRPVTVTPSSMAFILSCRQETSLGSLQKSHHKGLIYTPISRKKSFAKAHNYI
jgi:hypothetical protein